uniref:Glycerate kinase n=1 Tax=Phallusia mammillata TaxID=59560 RepID=A0A6F9DMY4_9ASCI|nr:glycerate kinase-like [Phallusia mammillata]
MASDECTSNVPFSAMYYKAFLILKHHFFQTHRFAMSCLARNVFLKSVESVAPDQLVLQKLDRKRNTLFLGEYGHVLDKNVYVIGFGKAVCGMCRALQQIIGDHIVSGVISVPSGLPNNLRKNQKSYLLPLDDGKIKVIEGAKDNLPDDDAVEAAKQIVEITQKASFNDLVIALVSGGGSALLPAPIPPISLDIKKMVTKALAEKGATIQELNIVRQQLSLVKGGKLLQFAYPAKVWGLILSDLVDDQVNLIASGPTVINEYTSADALKILEQYEVKNTPLMVSSFSKSPSDHTPMTADVVNCVVGNNELAVNEGLSEARRHGFTAVALSRTLHGEAKQLGFLFADLGIDLASMLEIHDPCRVTKLRSTVERISAMSHSTIEFESIFTTLFPSVISKGLCLIGGGETTVTLQSSSGQGGRNQEMVLAAAIRLCERLEGTENNCEITFLSAGTDGQDGPTPAAGAVFCSSDLTKFDLAYAKECLVNHNSYSFFKDHGTVMTGLTGTNVMDIQALVVRRTT